MERALMKGSFSCLMAGALVGSSLADELQASLPAAVEQGVVTETPAAPPPVPMRPAKKARPRRSVSRFAGRAVESLLNYYPRHLARLLPSKRHLPDHLAHREHWDYPGPLQWVPRGWTTFDWGQPAMLLGNQENALDGSPMPIGERGSFQISVYPDLPVPFCWLPVYFAFTLPNGVHFRLGARWDDVDSYVNLPSVAIKRNVE